MKATTASNLLMIMLALNPLAIAIFLFNHDPDFLNWVNLLGTVVFGWIAGRRSAGELI